MLDGWTFAQAHIRARHSYHVVLLVQAATPAASGPTTGKVVKKQRKEAAAEGAAKEGAAKKAAGQSKAVVRGGVHSWGH